MFPPGFTRSIPALVAAAAVLQGGARLEPTPARAGALWREEHPWPCARVPMPGAPRSIVIPLATNLHVAFDAALLRTHTVWTGPRLALSGYHVGGGGPFSHHTGVTLWTNPPVCPWASGLRPTNSPAARPDNFHFRGLSTKGDGVTLLYEIAEADGRAVRIHETPRALPSAGGAALRRRFEIGRATGPLWLLAHLESGQILDLGSTNASACAMQREKDVLLCAIIGWATMSVEACGNNASKVWIQFPPHDEPESFEVVTAICRDAAEARKTLAALSHSAPSLSPARMESLTNSTPDSSPRAPLTLAGGAKPGRVDGDAFYRREQIPVPAEFDLLVGGMDWLPGGDLAIATWPGEIYRARGLTGEVTQITWRRFASGLQDPLGLTVVDGRIHVAQKSELTRVTDTDGDGEADLYETLADDWGFNGDLHYFAYGPVLDRDGNFCVTLDGNTGAWNPQWDQPFRGWAVKIDRVTGRVESVAAGLRSPNGVAAFGLDRDIFCTDNEGHWLGTCKLNHCRPGKFFGYPTSTPMPREVFQKPDGFDPPAVWLPRRLSTSASGLAPITDERLGPFRGQMLVGDFGTASILRVALEKVDGEWQGAVWPFARGFLSGVNRLTFGPDGRLYVGSLKRGWGSAGPLDCALERLTFTGVTPFEVREARALRDGFELHLTQPVEAASAARPDDWEVSQFTYKFHAAYGSPEVDHAGKDNSATAITVAGVTVSPDGQRVTLRVAGWKAGYVTAVRCKALKSAAGAPLWHDTFFYTLNRIPQ